MRRTVKVQLVICAPVRAANSSGRCTNLARGRAGQVRAFGMDSVNVAGPAGPSRTIFTAVIPIGEIAMG